MFEICTRLRICSMYLCTASREFRHSLELSGAVYARVFASFSEGKDPLGFLCVVVSWTHAQKSNNLDARTTARRWTTRILRKSCGFLIYRLLQACRRPSTGVSSPSYAYTSEATRPTWQGTDCNAHGDGQISSSSQRITRSSATRVDLERT